MRTQPLGEHLDFRPPSRGQTAVWATQSGIAMLHAFTMADEQEPAAGRSFVGSGPDGRAGRFVLFCRIHWSRFAWEPLFMEVRRKLVAPLRVGVDHTRCDHAIKTRILICTGNAGLQRMWMSRRPVVVVGGAFHRRGFR